MSRILISTGDYSADLHGQFLIQELKKCDPSLFVIALGGIKLKSVSNLFLKDLVELDVSGFTQPLKQFFNLKNILQKIVFPQIDKNKIDAVILIDYYGFNIHVAEKATKENIPVFYFVSPQVWASRKWRIQKLKKNVTKMLVIFPFEEALYLTRFASKVNIIHRRDALRAERMYQERAVANPKINFIWDTVVTSVNGTDKVESISVQNVKTGENSELKTDAVFPYIGYSPNTELFREQIKLDPQGFIETDINLATSCEGVFAAGDVRVSPLRQVVISAADGAISATSAVKYLEEKQVLHV